jgi:poly(A) polymerase
MDSFERRLSELRAKEELAAIRPDLDGRDVMEHLGIRPGPLVGRALAHLLEARLEEGPHSREEALRLLDEWWASQPESQSGSPERVD